MSTILLAGALAVVLAAGYALAAGAGTSSVPGAGGQSGTATASAAPSSPFVDVPPCHWAKKAVARVTRLGLFVGFPPDPGYDSVNALRQVFEGLKCGQPAWSMHFLAGVPHAFASSGDVSLAGFRLDPSIVSLGHGKARIAFRLTAVIDARGTQRTLERKGTVTASHGRSGWQLPYAELAKLDLPVFPR